MIEENKKVRYAEEKPKSCEKCYWWDSKEKKLRFRRREMLLHFARQAEEKNRSM